MTEKNALTMFPRAVIYAAMVVLLAAIFVGAANEAPPVFLAVGFIAEVILVATAHLSSVIQQTAT
ncbi:MAG: hypothetical protein IID42_14290, partial [Planctomycetes bacterium]|nr:hypothetical protein [Planctomycetota bacterium]